MNGRFLPYPDLWRARLGLIAADTSMLLWIVLWIWIGVQVHAAFWSLHVLADAVIATGNGIAAAGVQIDHVVTDAQGVASSLASVELVLRNALAALLTLISEPVETVGHTVEAVGQQLTQALQGLRKDVAGLAFGAGSTLSTAFDPLIALAHTITDLGARVVSAGQDLRTKVRALQQTAATLPALRAGLSGAVSPLHTVPRSIAAMGRSTVAQGQHELAVLGDLALLMGVLAAAVPVGMALCLYLLWRAAATRSFRHLDTILRQPGAMDGTAALKMLAGRAIYTLPYDRLARYTADPIGAWQAGRYEELARAAMAEEGLDPRRYLRPTLQDGRPIPWLSNEEQDE